MLHSPGCSGSLHSAQNLRAFSPGCLPPSRAAGGQPGDMLPGAARGEASCPYDSAPFTGHVPPAGTLWEDTPPSCSSRWTICPHHPAAGLRPLPPAVSWRAVETLGTSRRQASNITGSCLIFTNYTRCSYNCPLRPWAVMSQGQVAGR